MSSDWLPRYRADRLAMAKTWTEVLAGRWSDWEIKEYEVADLLRHYNKARAAFDASNPDPETPGPVSSEAIKSAMKALVSYMRYVKERRFFVPPLTDADLVSLGLSPRGPMPVQQPVPSTVPEIETNASATRELMFRVRDFGSKGWAKPAYVHGFEFVWAIMENTPAQIDKLTNVVTAMGNPIKLTFDEADCGKRIYFAVRWLNNTLQPGPWSDIESAVIP